MREGSIYGENLLRVLFLLLILSFIVPFFRQILDIDFWWHLATGREIYKQGSLLTEDPFTYTFRIFPSPERMGILTRYWAGQVLLYISTFAGGLRGAIFLRVFILLAILITGGLYLWKVSPMYSLLYISLAGLTLTDYTGIRPQLYSFLCFTVLVIILDSMTGLMDASGSRKKWKQMAVLSLLMLVWANLHPGYILGTVMLIIFLLSEGMTGLKRGESVKDIVKTAALFSLPILVSLVNPVTHKSYLSLLTFEGSLLQSRTSEYVSPVVYLLKGGPYLPGFWISIPICLFLAVRQFRQGEVTRMVLSGFLLIISLTAFRYVPFFVVGGLILAGKSFAARYDREQRRILSIAVILMLAGLTISNISGIRGVSRTLNNPVNDRRFPVTAVKFINSVSLPPQIFNHFNWGGYLEWNLYPRYRFFIDSRTLSKRAFRDYTYMLWDPAKWKALMDRYGIRTVIMPPQNPSTGEPYGLPRFLFADPDWKLVYRDEVALIFIRSHGGI